MISTATPSRSLNYSNVFDIMIKSSPLTRMKRLSQLLHRQLSKLPKNSFYHSMSRKEQLRFIRKLIKKEGLKVDLSIIVLLLRYTEQLKKTESTSQSTTLWLFQQAPMT